MAKRKSKCRSKPRKKRFKRSHQQEQDGSQVHESADEHEQGQGQGQKLSPECNVEFCSFIKKQMHALADIIETQFGLLDVLIGKNGLTNEQVSLIFDKNTRTSQVRQLLDEITRQPITDEKRDLFLNALDETHQKHISNFIRGEGERSAEYGDDWPIYCCAEFQIMTTNRSKFIELVDARNGLLDEMMAAYCITERQRQSIDARAAEVMQNGTLYSLIYRGSLAAYKAFVRCLLKTKQHQVVYLLAPNQAGDIRPLGEAQQSRIQANLPTLIKLICFLGDLTAELWAADCITWSQKEYIEQKAMTRSESNARLLNIVRKGSETNFYKFIECLNKTGQHHVSRILVEDGIGALIVATISPVNSRGHRERKIVEQLTDLLRDTPDDRREELLGALSQDALRGARQLINELDENEVTMLQPEIHHSVGLYFNSSLRGLQYLHELYVTGRLQTMVQELFILSLKTVDDMMALDLRVETLRWDPSNYIDCLQQLFSSMSLPILSHVYEIAKHDVKFVSSSDDVRSIQIDQLPFELIEMILVRTTGHLFITTNKTMPASAEVHTLVTMWAVCRLWWKALTNRKFIKRQLKRSFKHVCHPFKCSSRNVTCLHIEGGKNVWGMAVLNDELFVACEGSETIQVFDSRPPFSRRKNNVKVQGLIDASDITVCSKSSQLYIADYAQCAIWRVNLLCIEPPDKFIAVQWKPFTLSVHLSGRILVTPWDGESLYLYGNGGNELRRIELPSHTSARHAVETTRNTYIVGHYDRFIGDAPLQSYGVTEVDVNGRVIRTLNDDIDYIHFHWPRYLVLDNDHVIVADLNNERIILLKSDLRMERILISDLRGKQPQRICLTSSRLLLVSYYESTAIDVFKI